MVSQNIPKDFNIVQHTPPPSFHSTKIANFAYLRMDSSSV